MVWYLIWYTYVVDDAFAADWNFKFNYLSVFNDLQFCLRKEVCGVLLLCERARECLELRGRLNDGLAVTLLRSLVVHILVH